MEAESVEAAVQPVVSHRAEPAQYHGTRNCCKPMARTVRDAEDGTVVEASTETSREDDLAVEHSAADS